MSATYFYHWSTCAPRLTSQSHRRQSEPERWTDLLFSSCFLFFSKFPLEVSGHHRASGQEVSGPWSTNIFGCFGKRLAWSSQALLSPKCWSNCRLSVFYVMLHELWRDWSTCETELKTDNILSYIQNSRNQNSRWIFGWISGFSAFTFWRNWAKYI